MSLGFQTNYIVSNNNATPLAINLGHARSYSAIIPSSISPVTHKNISNQQVLLGNPP